MVVHATEGLGQQHHRPASRTAHEVHRVGVEACADDDVSVAESVEDVVEVGQEIKVDTLLQGAQLPLDLGALTHGGAPRWPLA